MRCIKCGKEIKDGVAFCEFCGAKQNGSGGLSSMLVSYPNVYNSYMQTLKLIAEGNYDYAANAMRKTVEAMVDFIVSSCKFSDKLDKLSERIEALKGKNLITPLTYKSYTMLRLFGNEHSHVGNVPATQEECLMCLDVLKTELNSFIDTYSKVDYSKIVLNEPITPMEGAFSRIFGMVLVLVGGFFTYWIITDFGFDYLMIITIGVLIFGLSLFIGGGKVLSKVLKIFDFLSVLK